jgi:uncharacterized repeat protein (TIGR03803 family)
MNSTLKAFSQSASTRSLATATFLIVFAASALASGNLQVIYRFQGGTDGFNPSGALLIDNAGNLYGTTVEGGTIGSCGPDQGSCGTVFQLTPPAHPGDPWTETVLYRFIGGADGYGPGSALVADKDGNLYGTTALGGVRENGTVFELKRPASPGAAWSHHVLYGFQGVPSGRGDGDGSLPGPIVFDTKGNLYGTTDGGGACTEFEGLVNCYGSVFELAAPSQPGGAWTESVLHRFGTTGDSNPHGGVVFDNKGNLYGTAYLGGAYGFGGVFELTPPSAPGNPWSEATLYDFNNIDGGVPNGSLRFDNAGNLYGTTLQGGAANMGTVFALTPPASANEPWTETVLYSFQSSSDGDSPLASVIFDKSGNLFSTDWIGGEFNRGTVFQLTPPSNDGVWTKTTLHNFGSGQDGQEPTAALIWGPDGLLYGTTANGGSKATSQCMLDGYAWTCGVVFRIKP